MVLLRIVRVHKSKTWQALLAGTHLFAMIFNTPIRSFCNAPRCFPPRASGSLLLCLYLPGRSLPRTLLQRRSQCKENETCDWEFTGHNECVQDCSTLSFLYGFQLAAEKEHNNDSKETFLWQHLLSNPKQMPLSTNNENAPRPRHHNEALVSHLHGLHVISSAEKGRKTYAQRVCCAFLCLNCPTW